MPEVNHRLHRLKAQITQIKAKIIANRQLTEEYFKIFLHPSEIAEVAKPGQFIEIKVADSYEPLLRRPFSIHRIRGKNLEILYEVVGKGTGILSQKKQGECLDVIGPLGNGFTLIPNTHNLASILVAGGIGIAPLLFLAEELVRSQKSEVTSKFLVLIGAKTKAEILCEKEFKELGCEVKISTDDGSKGFKGKVTDLLKYLLSTMNYELSTIYACGPHLMLKEISRISQKYDIPAQISLDEHMACGIGACLGCVVKTKEGYQRVCQEGPVFKAEQIVW